jgi:PIN domain-containing protein
MIVYVETNFVLELTYLQEGCDSCEELLKLAEGGAINLVLPAFSAVEARGTWKLDATRRADVHAKLEQEIKQLRRSKPFKEIRGQTNLLTTALIDNVQEDRTRLEEILDRIGKIGVMQALDQNIIAKARKFEQDLALSPQDAVVYGSVLEHLQGTAAGPKVFVTRNAKDFSAPTIEDQLNQLDCKLLTKFQTAVEYILSVIKRAG